eukprot:tig00000350_g24349.t1
MGATSSDLSGWRSLDDCTQNTASNRTYFETVKDRFLGDSDKIAVCSADVVAYSASKSPQATDGTSALGVHGVVINFTSFSVLETSTDGTSLKTFSTSDCSETPLVDELFVAPMNAMDDLTILNYCNGSDAKFYRLDPINGGTSRACGPCPTEEVRIDAQCKAASGEPFYVLSASRQETVPEALRFLLNKSVEAVFKYGINPGDSTVIAYIKDRDGLDVEDVKTIMGVDDAKASKIIGLYDDPFREVVLLHWQQAKDGKIAVGEFTDCTGRTYAQLDAEDQELEELDEAFGAEADFEAGELEAEAAEGDPFAIEAAAAAEVVAAF